MLSVLILAHKNEEQLLRLISSLQHEEIDIYIHLDRKWNIEDFFYDELKLKYKNVYIVKKRISAELDRWSLVEATYELLNTAFLKKYKYYSLVSGQDYPIKSLDYIINKLKNDYPKFYVDCTPWQKKNWIYMKFCSTRIFQKLDYELNCKLRPGILRKIIKLPLICINKVIAIKFDMKSVFHKYNINLYGGSAWWIIPDCGVEYILNSKNENNKCYELFKKFDYVTPEETFFQTILMNSKFSSMLEVNSPDMIEQNCKTFAYFSDVNKPFKGHPYTLTIENLEMLLKLDSFFARKFDISEDKIILDKLDSYNKRS